MSGFASLANTIIRNNKRKRLDKFERVARYIGSETSVAEYNEASPYLLNQIRDDIQEQQRKFKRKTIVIFVIVGFVLISVMSYFLFIHEFPNEVPLLFRF